VETEDIVVAAAAAAAVAEAEMEAVGNRLLSKT